MLEVVIAGGSGGLGAVCTRALGNAFRLVVSYRSNEQRARSLKDVASIVRADLTAAADRATLLDAAPKLYGLVVFAGDPVRGLAPQDAMVRSHEANYLGPVLLAREAAERMRKSETPGAIVLISTMQAVSFFAGSTAYAAQK